MALSKEEILDAISEMSVMDIVDLISAMEEKFGVTAAAPVAAAAAAAPAAEGGATEEEAGPVELMLTEVGDKKVDVIKAVRAITGLGLKDAKGLVDGAPSSLKEGVERLKLKST
ncbi:MAG: 50S ribosomal protein L7/L12 [Gammaproteobacteria bacterium]|nr:MAG: 50S ribosomal protein L7/L12 [Gammaproteobacteria bacterium]